MTSPSHRPKETPTFLNERFDWAMATLYGAVVAGWLLWFGLVAHSFVNL